MGNAVHQKASTPAGSAAPPFDEAGYRQAIGCVLDELSKFTRLAELTGRAPFLSCIDRPHPLRVAVRRLRAACPGAELPADLQDLWIRLARSTVIGVHRSFITDLTDQMEDALNHEYFRVRLESKSERAAPLPSEQTQIAGDEAAIALWRSGKYRTYGALVDALGGHWSKADVARLVDRWRKKESRARTS